MLKPTPEQLASLTRMERIAYHFSDFCVRYFKWILKIWNRWFTISFVNISTGRRVRIDGLEHLQQFTKKSNVILVSNHRSFFDFYTISWITYRLTRIGQRSFFPVRSTFFYEGFLGIFVNFFVAGMAMFPPIMRSKDNKKRSFNQYAMDRVKAELKIPGTVVGMHPEGTRNKEGDGYTFLKVRAGVGELAIEAKGATVIPIFIYGLTNKIFTEMKLNFFAVKGNEIDVVIGEPLDFSDFEGREGDRDAYMEAAERCMDAVRQLGQRQKQISIQRKEQQSTPS